MSTGEGSLGRETTFKYRAFLSYRTADARQAEWLHQRLEAYVVPRALVGAHGDYGVVPRRLGRIFRDRDEARSAEDIETVISLELSRSLHLVVLCTPNAAAAGSWVPREIELFRQRRPDGVVHAAIGRGQPPECFPAALLKRTVDGRIEVPLAADLRSPSEGGGDGREKGVIRLIAGLLGVSFDDLWRREERRRRARWLTATAGLVATVLMTIALVAGSAFYRSHTLVEVSVGELSRIADLVTVTGSEESPERNASRAFAAHAVNSSRIQMWVPASDVIVRVRAAYHDGADRGLAFHVMLSPGFDPATKQLQVVLPQTDDIAAHPGMAYVPATSWFHGRDSEPRTNHTPFWIDLRPPTVAQYDPIARQLFEQKKLEPDASFLLTARRQQAAVNSTGLFQLHGLNKDLGVIAGIIAAGTSPNISAPGDLVAGLVDLPCDSCPAPMTRHEADVYCSSRNMRLPTDLEWELAVRGVDGRVYPWGSRFDDSRANVPGLPAKGAPSPALKPVDAYRDQTSPFGLIDTVGNAGDWVVNDSTAYERVYMGATYRYNPEDATSFRLLPVTDSDYLVQPITARCVSQSNRK